MAKKEVIRCESCGENKLPGSIRKQTDANLITRNFCLDCIERDDKRQISNLSKPDHVVHSEVCNRCNIRYPLEDLNPGYLKDSLCLKYYCDDCVISHPALANLRPGFNESEAVNPIDNAEHTGSKYKRTFKGVTLDVYDTIELWAVTCPARQHAIKKLLCAGERGKNDTLADLKEARDAVTRAIELQLLREEN